MAANPVKVRKILGNSNVVRLRKVGYTVTDFAISGGPPGKHPDGPLKRWIPGGPKTLSRLRKAGVYP